jgi:hypothetical protein
MIQYLPIDKDTTAGRTVLVRVCIRDGWDAGGWAGQHKYFWWADGSFTGMGSTTSEPTPDIELGGDSSTLTIKWGDVEHQDYYVTAAVEKQMKELAAARKVEADKRYLGVVPKWKPWINDCHTLVDDTLRECNLPPTKLGRFDGHSADKYSLKTCTIL